MYAGYLLLMKEKIEGHNINYRKWKQAFESKGM